METLQEVQKNTEALDLKLEHEYIYSIAGTAY